jgi:hypothetical protein
VVEVLDAILLYGLLGDRNEGGCKVKINPQWDSRAFDRSIDLIELLRVNLRWKKSQKDVQTDCGFFYYLPLSRSGAPFF